MATKPKAQRPRRYQKHGLLRLKQAVKDIGGRVIDRRTVLGRTLETFKADLIADLGGADVLSTQARSLVELAVRTKLMLDSIDAWLLSQPSLIDKRKRSLLPVVKERASLASSFRDLMRDLGLERRARPIASLAEIMKSAQPNESKPIESKEA